MAHHCDNYSAIFHMAGRFCLTPAKSVLGILSHLFLSEAHALQTAFLEDFNAHEILFHERNSVHSLLAC